MPHRLENTRQKLRKKLGITSELDLKKLAKFLKIPKFKVFPIDQLPPRLPQSINTIINSDHASGGGTHWTCLYTGPNYKYTIYVDPFGIPPDQRTIDWAKTGRKQLVALTNDFQYIDAESCGYWCLWFLFQLNLGKPLEQITSQCKQDPKKNEQMLEEFFNHH